HGSFATRSRHAQSSRAANADRAARWPRRGVLIADWGKRAPPHAILRVLSAPGFPPFLWRRRGAHSGKSWRQPMLDLILRGGDVVTPEGVVRCDVAIKGETIAALTVS